MVKESKKGISHARNKGAKVAFGNVYCFCDADHLVSKDWLKTADKLLRSADADSGLNIFENKSLLKKIYYNTYTTFTYSIITLVGLLTGKTFLIGCNMAIKSDLFWELGGFEPIVVEDVWMSRKFAKIPNKTSLWSPKMICRVSSRGFDTKGFIRTLAYWTIAAFVKTPQTRYSFSSQEKPKVLTLLPKYTQEN